MSIFLHAPLLSLKKVRLSQPYSKMFCMPVMSLKVLSIVPKTFYYHSFYLFKESIKVLQIRFVVRRSRHSLIGYFPTCFFNSLIG